MIVKLCEIISIRLIVRLLRHLPMSVTAVPKKSPARRSMHTILHGLLTTLTSRHSVSPDREYTSQQMR